MSNNLRIMQRFDAEGNPKVFPDERERMFEAACRITEQLAGSGANPEKLVSAAVEAMLTAHKKLFAAE